MKIIDVKTYPVRVPLIHEFKAAYGIRSTADFVLTEIVLENDLSGWGEASTIPIYDEGSQSDVVYVIEHYFKPLLVGKDPTNIAQLMALLDRTVKGSRYAKCAIDFSLHDLAGKLFGLPVYKMLGGGPDRLPVCWVLSAKASDDVQKEAREKFEEGYRYFKLKVGSAFEADLNNLKALRETIGSDASIRLDGNEAWEPKEALGIIREFEQYNPEHIEQPVPAWNIEGLKFVRDHTNIPIVADECILTPKDVMRVARAEAADRINIKISRGGGTIPARKIAAIAQAAGQTPFAGSNLELGLGTMASAHVFAATPEASLTTELVGPLLLKEDILKTPVKYENGFILLSDLPGWGVDVDRSQIDKFHA